MLLYSMWRHLANDIMLLLMDFIMPVFLCYYYYSYIQHIESTNTGKWQYYTCEEVSG